MDVELRVVRSAGCCWNVQAITFYAGEVNGQEARLAGNPDLTIVPGKIACQGCVVNEGGYGTFCTAQLTETQAVLKGQTPPLSEDAYAATSRIPNFEGIKPGSGKMARGYVPPVEEPAPIVEVSQPTPPAKRSLLRRFGR